MSLKELCLKNIANTILQMPPGLQEMVISESTTLIKEQLRAEIREELREEVLKQVHGEVLRQSCDILPYIVPEIIQDIIHSMTNINISRSDYFTMYSNIPREIIMSAVKTAEYSVTNLEERYIYNQIPDTGNTFDYPDFYNYIDDNYEPY
jgi:hypothetical protein